MDKRRRTTILTIAIFAALSLGGMIGLIERDKHSGEDAEIDDIWTAVMEYIKENHLDAAVFIGEPSQMVWSLNSSEIKVGYSRYVYTSDGWEMTIGYPITAKRVYEVRAEYDEKIVWTGTVDDGVITETGYTCINATDLNHDGEVDTLDLCTVAKAFGSKEGDPNYDPIADLDGNKKINIIDTSKVARDFGKTV